MGSLQIIKETGGNQFVIYSDSKSSIQAIQQINSTHPIVAKILRTLVRLAKKKTVKFCWVPSHVGVAGN